MSPSLNGSNGRAPDGRFAKGWKGGPGNPFAAQVATLRAVLLDAVTPDRMRAVAEKLLSMAERGDLDAARLVLDRVFGRPVQAVDLDVQAAPNGPTWREPPVTVIVSAEAAERYNKLRKQLGTESEVPS